MVIGLCMASAAQAQTAADSAWLRGDTGTAERLYSAVLRADSANPTALHRMALMHAWAKRYDESLRLFDRLIGIAPDAIDARVDRARVFAFRGDYDASIAALDSIIAQHPTNAAALHALATTRAWKGDLIEAERLARQALALDPTNVGGMVVLGQTLRFQGRNPAALRVLEQARLREPTNGDVREQLSLVNAALAPRAAPSFTVEHDSDDNSIASTRLASAVHLRPELTAQGDGYFRETSFLELDQQAYGAVLGLAYLAEPGWRLSASAGASTSDVADARTFPLIYAGVSSPTRNRWTASLNFAHTAFDATTILIRREVTTSDLSATVNVREVAGVNVALGASSTWYDSEVSGASNHRVMGLLTLTRPLSSAWALGTNGRAFGFSETTFDGYFNPDRYLMGEIFGRWTVQPGRFVVMAEAAPGLEQIASEADASGTLRALGRLTYNVAAGRTIEVFGMFANSGLNQLSQAVDTEYRYTAFGISVTWTF